MARTRASRRRRASGRARGSARAPAFPREQGGVDARSASLRAPLRRRSREYGHAPSFARMAGSRRSGRSTSARGVARTSAGDRGQRRPASVRRTYRVRIVFAPTGAIRTPRNGPSRGRMRARAETDATPARRATSGSLSEWWRPLDGRRDVALLRWRRRSRRRSRPYLTCWIDHHLKKGGKRAPPDGPALPPVTCGRGGRTAGGQRGPTLRRRLARRRGRGRRGRTPRGGRRGRRSSLRSR